PSSSRPEGAGCVVPNRGLLDRYGTVVLVAVGPWPAIANFFSGGCRMRPGSLMTILLRGFESTIVIAVGLVLAMAVVIAVAELYLLIFDDVRSGLSLETLNSVQEGLQNVFGAVLLVLLGLELIDT